MVTAWGKGPAQLNSFQKGEVTVVLTLNIPNLALITQPLGPIFPSNGAEKNSYHFPLKGSGRKIVNSSFTCQTGVT